MGVEKLSLKYFKLKWQRNAVSSFNTNSLGPGTSLAGYLQAMPTSGLWKYEDRQVRGDWELYFVIISIWIDKAKQLLKKKKMMYIYANMPNRVHSLCQLQSTSRGCLECCVEHREATCGFSKKKCQDQLAMAVADGGLRRRTGHVVHSGPGPGSQVLRRKAVSYRIWSGSESHKLNGLQELDSHRKRKM